MNNHTLPSGHLLTNRYKIEKVLGQGGFGISYKAYDNKLMQAVCVKELFISGNSTRGDKHQVNSQNLQEFSFADFVIRFMDEARKLAQFRHHNIVQVQDVFEENNTAYMVMEFVEGVTLKDLVEKKGKLPVQEVIGLTNQLLNAVEKVHQKGMLHRDIKPDNLLLTDDNRLVLIDFGSAREFAEGKTISQTAMVTPGYAPMEQYSNQAKRGAYTDIYSIGATLYFMVTGEKPLASTDRDEEELKFPEEVPKEISNAINKAMELKPKNRFQNIQDLRDALVSKIGITYIIPKPPKPTHPITTLAGLATALALLIALIVVWVNYGGQVKDLTYENARLVNYQTRLREVAKEIPFLVDSMDFKNDNNGVLIDDFTTLFPKQQNLRFVTPRIHITPLIESGIATMIPLDIKVIKPNGSLLMNQATSPAGYSYTTQALLTSGSKFVVLTGWGNAESSIFELGRHKVQIWYKGRLLGEGTWDVLLNRLNRLDLNRS